MLWSFFDVGLRRQKAVVTYCQGLETTSVFPLSFFSSGNPNLDTEEIEQCRGRNNLKVVDTTQPDVSFLGKWRGP